MKTFLSIAFVLAVTHISCPLLAQQNTAKDLDYFLPDNTTYDPRVPTPESALGYQVGEWHVRHDQLVAYMKKLSETSDRMRVFETGRTYENRPLLLGIITSSNNWNRITTIQKQHLNLSLPGQPHPPLEDMPAVVYLGYSVHGNESSGSNASLLIAYYLNAAQGHSIDALLENTIILLDPSLNPDGLSRFSHWANMYRGKNLIADANHREHREVWPGGRTNHYWFDLNRDWLLLQHPESRARIKPFHDWKPNILGDFHEMGSNATYFFQPGEPTRTHPLTPDMNYQLTKRIAQHHAEALDSKQVLYFSQEQFDDFYYGKGSTYPDVNGCIGILFEQASSRGHLRESVHGEFDFAYTIRNQCLTSLSTLNAAQDLRVELLEYQRHFYESALEQAKRQRIKAIVFGSSTNRGATKQLLDVFRHHAIIVHELTQPIEQNGETYSPGTAFLVPMEQAQYRLVKALTETRTTFTDSLFYDVSTWTFPLAMGVPYEELKKLPQSAMGPRVSDTSMTSAALPNQAEYAYVFPWNEYLAPRSLARLLKKDVRAQVATRPFSVELSTGEQHEYTYGTIMVPLGIQEMGPLELHEIMLQIAKNDFVQVEGLDTGLTPSGVDFGSPSLRSLEMPHPMIVIGSGSSSYEVGELWHLLDQKMDIEVSLVDVSHLGGIDLHRYTHIIMVDGNYSTIQEPTVDKLKSWLHSGGVFIATKGAVRWARNQGLADVTFLDDPEEEEKEKENQGDDKNSANGEPKATPRYSYGDHERRENAHIIGGAIFETDVDITHPIGFGFQQRSLAVFRNHRWFMKPSKNPYATVVQYTQEPLISGYISSRNLAKLPGTSSVIAERSGRGSVILFLDNPNFRGFWLGTNKLFLNALFFGSILENTK